MERFDILILGAGPAGYVSAIRAAQFKKRVCVIEKNEVGGTCLNKGCIPTKSLIASANLFASIKRASEFGISIEKAAVNFKIVQERKKRVVDSGRKGIESLFKKYGIILEQGTAVFKEPFAVEIRKENGETKILSGDKIIISTGSHPSDIPGVIADNEYIFNSDSILETDNLPASLTIIGGGAVGCEFAHIFSSFGVKVNIIELMPHLIPLEDEDISSTLEREFKKKGIKIFLSKRVEGVSKGEGKVHPHTLTVGHSQQGVGVKIVLSDGAEIESERLLLSVGRRFNTAGLGIENTGVKTGEKGNILVDDKMESAISGVYAAGDVAGRAMLAYTASKEGIVAAENAAGIEGKMDYSVVPSAVFTEPEIGCVGLKEKEAVERGIKINKGSFQFRALGRAHASGEISGMVKVISEAATDKILGVHIIGAHASEMVHEAVAAIKMGMTSKELENTMHAHPVYSEGIMEAAADVHGRAIHNWRNK